MVINVLCIVQFIPAGCRAMPCTTAKLYCRVLAETVPPSTGKQDGIAKNLHLIFQHLIPASLSRQLALAVLTERKRRKPTAGTTQSAWLTSTMPRHGLACPWNENRCLESRTKELIVCLSTTCHNFVSIVVQFPRTSWPVPNPDAPPRATRHPDHGDSYANRHLLAF